MTPIAKTLWSALFTPGLLNGERERREIAKRARDGRKTMCKEMRKGKLQDKKEHQWHFFPSALHGGRGEKGGEGLRNEG